MIYLLKTTRDILFSDGIYLSAGIPSDGHREIYLI